LDTPSLFGAATKLPDTSDNFDVRSDVTYLTWLGPTTFALKERQTLEIKAPDLPEKLGAFGKLDTEAAGGGASNRPARRFINFSAEATCQVVPGRGYRILAVRPGTFERPAAPDEPRRDVPHRLWHRQWPALATRNVWLDLALYVMRITLS